MHVSTGAHRCVRVVDSKTLPYQGGGSISRCPRGGRGCGGGAR